MNVKQLDASAALVRSAWGSQAPPDGTLILGSGWSAALQDAAMEPLLPYDAIPAMGASRIQGHAGRLAAAHLGHRRVLLFLGRRHWYEGDGWEPVAFPVHAALRLGSPIVLLTNSAGGIRAELQPGDLMIIRDHINAMGDNPLRGPHQPCWGARFPDQSRVYDPELCRQLKQAGEQSGTALHEGIYLAAAGPVYETPAEIRTFAGWGADAIGMSTVPEATLAHAAGLRVAALSCISNRAADEASALSHAEVVSTAERARPAMRAVLEAFVGMLPNG